MFLYSEHTYRPKAHVPREGFETTAVVANRRLRLSGRRHTFPERGLRPVPHGRPAGAQIWPKAHVPREGFETCRLFSPAPSVVGPKAHVPREGFETNVPVVLLYSEERPKAHVPREGFETGSVLFVVTMNSWAEGTRSPRGV